MPNVSLSTAATARIAVTDDTLGREAESTRAPRRSFGGVPDHVSPPSDKVRRVDDALQPALRLLDEELRNALMDDDRHSPYPIPCTPDGLTLVPIY